MKTNIKLLLIVLVSVTMTSKAQFVASCPGVNAGPDLSQSCTDSCTTLNAQFLETAQSTQYRAEPIPYNPFPYTIGTGISIGIDDIFSNVITLPFPFCFYGTNYTELTVGSNGIISFNTNNADPILNPSFANPGYAYCEWSFTDPLPSPNLYPPSICGPYHDIDPSVCGNVRQGVYGIAPCRTFVVSFDNICQFSCTTTQSRHQIVLYESTGIIEVYVESKPTCFSWNSGNAVIGIQDAAGANATVAPGRNTGSWTVSTPEAWRFSPDGAPTYSFNWFDMEGNNLGNAANLDVCPDTTSSYRAEVVYTSCSGATLTYNDTVEVAVAENFDFSVNVTDTADCGQSNGVAAAVAPVGANPPLTYSWDNGQSGLVLAGVPAGDYCLTITDASNCQVTRCVTIPEIGPQIDSTNVIDANCDGENGAAGIFVSGGTGPYTYSWNDPNNQTDAVALGLDSGTYIVTVTDASNCVLIDSVFVDQPFENPNFNIEGPTVLCFPEAAILAGISDDTTLSYLWSTGQSGEIISVVPNQDTTITLTASNGACSSQSSIFIQVATPIQNLEILYEPDTTVLYGDSVTVTISGENITSYLWDVLGDSTASVVLFPGDSTLYEVALGGVPPCGDSVIFIPVNVIPEVDPLIPDAFTPNGDGLNDVFEVINASFFVTIEMRIYNRWGELVFEEVGDASSLEGWDGTYNGKQAPAGSYMTVVLAKQIGRPDKRQASGSVSLIR
ncbi:MAG: gliding motility-associated C-terminal domain-containing protein [Bacteroidota bacterium]|nr:gliding motility-associated C-terminal domain-containing protein [Bacteroidota bacterium]